MFADPAENDVQAVSDFLGVAEEAFNTKLFMEGQHGFGWVPILDRIRLKQYA